jgi:hypothetical protein
MWCTVRLNRYLQLGRTRNVLYYIIGTEFEFREGIAHFLKKKMDPNYRYQKCTRRGLVRYKKLAPGTKVHFSDFMTHGSLESRKVERFSFCLPCQCRTWDQENEIFTDKTHLLNQQEGRERVGGSEVLLRRGGCDNSKECMSL